MENFTAGREEIGGLEVRLLGKSQVRAWEVKSAYIAGGFLPLSRNGLMVPT